MRSLMSTSRKRANEEGFTCMRWSLPTMTSTTLVRGADTVYHLAAVPGVRGSWGGPVP